MLDPETNSLLLLYDDTQNIYGKQKKRSFAWSSVGIQATGRTTILQKNYRNTVEALNFSYQFLSSYVGDEKGTGDLPVVKPELGGRNGAVPKVRRLADAAEEYDFIAAWIEKRIARGFKAREIAVLCRFKNQIAQFGKELKKRGIATTDMFGKQDEDSARLSTMHSSKGLEFRGVVIPDLGCMPCRDIPPDEEARLLYVALTRSTESLLVTYRTRLMQRW